jgi:hypothetical protein
MPKGNSKNDQVSLRSVTEKGEVDTSYLEGLIDNQKITITTVLNNTAVYYFTGKGGRRLLESQEKITVNKGDVKYLPVMENLHPNNRNNKPKK